MAETDDRSRPHAAGDFVVRPVLTKDEPAVERMFYECFGTQRSISLWQWRWFGAPGSPGVAFVLESGGVPVGHWAGSTGDMWLGGRRKTLLLGGEIMVLPQYRRRGGMQKLVATARTVADRTADVWIAFATEEAARGSEAAGGPRVIGRMPTWVVWPRRIPHLPRAIGILAAQALKGWRGVVFSVLPCALVEGLGPLAWADIDRLAESAAAFAPCMRIRDSGYLRWRWIDRPEGAVDIFAARTRSGVFSGYAVVGIETVGPRRIGRVLDLLARDRASLRGLLRRSLADLTARDCEVITCDYLDPRPWSRSVLRTAGFIPRRGKVMSAVSTSTGAGTLPERLDSWYLTRGDTDVN